MAEIRIGRHILQPNRQLLLDGAHVHLGPRALSILTVLAEADGEIVTKDELMDAVWPDVTVEDNALQVHVTAVRKALGEDADRLTTLRGIGYQLDVATPHAPHEADGNHTPEPRAASASSGPIRPPLVATGLAVTAIIALLITALASGWFASEQAEAAEVTVYPFTSTSEDPQEAAFARGVTEEMIVRLRRIPELRVLTGDETMQGANNAIRGTVRTDASTLRVSVRLEDASGAVLWSDNFDRELNDLLSVQEEIAAAVADTLSVSLDVGVDSGAHGGTDNPEAYVNFVRGRAARYNPDPREAMAYLERAVELDPGFPRANAELIFAYGFRLFFATTQGETQDLLASMDRASAQALETAPDVAISHVARAWYFMAVNDLVAATNSMMQAEALDSGNDPDLKERMAAFASQFGRHQKQVELLQQRRLIDPVFARMERAGIQAGHHLYAGEIPEALEAYKAAVVSGEPIVALEHSVGYWANMLSGNAEAARNLPGLATFPGAASVYRQFEPGWHEAENFPNLPYPQLRQWADIQFGPSGAFHFAQMALFAGFAGEHQLAVDYMRLAAERPNVSGYFWFWHPALSETRESDLFEQLMFDLGFVEAWRESGDWGDFCRPVSDTEITCE